VTWSNASHWVRVVRYRPCGDGMGIRWRCEGSLSATMRKSELCSSVEFPAQPFSRSHSLRGIATNAIAQVREYLRTSVFRRPLSRIRRGNLNAKYGSQFLDGRLDWDIPNLETITEFAQFCMRALIPYKEACARLIGLGADNVMARMRTFSGIRLWV
jgi:hypothetical protein